MGRLIGFLAFLISIALLAGAGGAIWLYIQFTAPSRLARDVDVVIPRGVGVSGIATALRQAGIVRQEAVFVLGVRAVGLDRALQAGEYRFPAGVSPRQAAEIIRTGRTVKRYLTIPEGLTSRQILDRLAATEGLSDLPEAPPAEGSLLPETYQFAYGDSATELLARMRSAQEALLAELWPRRAEGLPFTTPREALILASIVEKETGMAGERGRVAGVFINRLRRGMRLQSDPTVLYALTGGAGLERPLSRKDLKFDHPYNTYRVQGLPPGPISHPGRAAIAAVLDPTPTDALYFVADGSGGHAFAKTLEEHNRNVARWRKLNRP